MNERRLNDLIYLITGVVACLFGYAAIYHPGSASLDDRAFAVLLALSIPSCVSAITYFMSTNNGV